MFNFHKNHRSLVLAAFMGFLFLSILVAVSPANKMQEVEPLPSQKKMTRLETQGLHIFVQEGCVACHTQQVRNIEMDKTWGSRPSIPSDYFYSKQRLDIWRQSPSLLGSERTGPDLTNIGARQPAAAWHLMHLFNPRSVVSESIMPSYPWLFKTVDDAKVKDDDTVISLPESYAPPSGKTVVAGAEALQLVAYLQSLKQTELPTGQASEFIPSSRVKEPSAGGMSDLTAGIDGENLYKQTCASCHQANGTGVAGAFPPLAGSEVVNDKDPDLLIKIILQGYDARPEYALMPAFIDQLSDAEIAAIANHERTSWGNSAPEITEEKVKEIRDFVLNQLPQ